MQPLVGLPDTVNISFKSAPALKIKNHQLQGRRCLMEMMLSIKRFENWNDAVLNMTSQGVKLEGVIEQCIMDLQDPKRLEEIFRHDYMELWKDERHALAVIPEGRAIATSIIKRMADCKNWEEFGDVLDGNGNFWKEIKSKLKDGLIRCIR